MYQKQSGLVLGFHGCDTKVQQSVLHSATQHLKSSINNYDWLGNGIYFWENSPARALQFAQEKRVRDKTIKTPAVLGAVIDLGKCLDLLDAENTILLKKAFLEISEIYATLNMPLPVNKAFEGHGKFNLLLRPLDCMVIEHLLKDSDFDSVRGLFPEGKSLYAGSGFRSKDHIQICIRKPSLCIKGYFMSRKINE